MYVCYNVQRAAVIRSKGKLMDATHTWEEKRKLLGNAVYMLDIQLDRID